MIGILILAQDTMGSGLIESVDHILGAVPPALEALPVNDSKNTPEELTAELELRLQRLDDGNGVLILADIFGSSHTNAACALLGRYHAELVAGVNLPMLVRVLNHRAGARSLMELAQKAVAGGREAIVSARQQLAGEGTDAA